MASPSSPVAVVSNTSQLEIEVLASETMIITLPKVKKPKYLLELFLISLSKGMWKL